MLRIGATRRRFLATAAAIPFATIPPLYAAAPMLGVPNVDFHRFKLGEFEITTLLASSMVVPNPHEIFGVNVSALEFEQASEAANISPLKTRFFFTPTLVNTGSNLILFDTGQSPDGLLAALELAGYSSDQVDIVVITHMHGDHIGGLMNDEAPTFSNARYVTGRVEFDSWSKSDDQSFKANVLPLAEQTTMLEDGATVVPGITAMAAFGHTPGHMAFLVESNGQALVLAVDFANHYVWSLANPEWELRFDMDRAAAVASRVRLLDMISQEKLPFIGYHMPWPAVGFVEKKNGRYSYMPESYQLSL